MNFVCHCKWCCDTNSCCCTFTKEIREHESLFRGDDNDDGNLLILKVWQKSVGYDWLFRPPAVRKLRGVKRPQLELPAVEYQPSITKEIGKFGPKSLEQTGAFHIVDLCPQYLKRRDWITFSARFETKFYRHPSSNFVQILILVKVLQFTRQFGVGCQ